MNVKSLTETALTEPCISMGKKVTKPLITPAGLSGIFGFPKSCHNTVMLKVNSNKAIHSK